MAGVTRLKQAITPPVKPHVFTARCYWWPACKHTERSTDIHKVQTLMEQHYETSHYPSLRQEGTR